MSYLSTKAKESIILKALTRGTATLESIAKKNNIGLSTLETWIRCYKNGEPLKASKKSKLIVELNHEEQFKVLSKLSPDLAPAMLL